MTAIEKYFQYSKKPLKLINGLIFGLNRGDKRKRGISMNFEIPLFMVRVLITDLKN